MSIQNIVNVQISRQTSVPSRAGFGTGAFLANDTTLSNPAKSYASTAEMTADAELTGSVALLAGAAYFGQQISPPKLTIIRQSTADVAQISTLVFSADLVADNSTLATIDGVDETAVVFITDMATTLTAIAVEIAGNAAVATAVSDGTDTITVTFTDFVAHVITAAVTLGASQATVTSANTTNAQAVQTLTQALDAGVAYNNDWYGLGIYSRLSADIDTVSTHIQGYGSANPKIYFAQNKNPLILDSGDATDIASVLQAKANFRTSVWYHSDDAEYLEMGLIGGQLPTDPGSITWAYKTVSGVTVDTLTDGQKSAAHAKACNTYTTEASVNITEEGKVSDSPFEWIDVIRGVDWIQVNMTADLFSLLVNLPKLPYDSRGLGSIKGTIQNTLSVAQTMGILSTDTQPVVFVPDLANISAADKGNRVLNGVTFTGILAGAIQKINVLGTVTL